jgi:hypothetical protein
MKIGWSVPLPGPFRLSGGGGGRRAPAKTVSGGELAVLTSPAGIGAMLANVVWIGGLPAVAAMGGLAGVVVWTGLVVVGGTVLLIVALSSPSAKRQERRDARRKRGVLRRTLAYPLALLPIGALLGLITYGWPGAIVASLTMYLTVYLVCVVLTLVFRLPSAIARRLR